MNRIANTLLNQPTSSPLAHGGGAIHGRIAGNVTNSIVSVSVDPESVGDQQPRPVRGEVTGRHFPFGAPDNIVLPRGTINVKVEGTIDNSAINRSRASQPTRPGLPVVDPDAPPTAAFFAKHVQVEHRPVMPPNVPEPPIRRRPYGPAEPASRGIYHDRQVGDSRSGPAGSQGRVSTAVAVTRSGEWRRAG